MSTVYTTTGDPVSVYTTDGTQVWGAPASTPGDPTPVGVLALLPEPMDAAVEQMRPEGKRRVVAHQRIDGGNITTAMTSLTQERAGVLATERRTTPTPDDWITLIVGPGDYEVGTGGLSLPRYSSLYVLDGARVHGGWRDRAGSTAAWGAVGTVHGGGTCHIEVHGTGVIEMEAMDEATSLPPKYTLHLQQMQRGTIQIILDGGTITQPAQSQGTVFGIDGAVGAHFIVYGTGSILRPGAATSADITHVRMAGTVSEPSMLAYVGGIKSNATLSAHPYSAAEGFPDVHGDFWVGPGDWPALMTTAGAKMTTHVDPAHAGPVSVLAGGQDARTDWPVPTGCLNEAQWQEWYG